MTTGTPAFVRIVRAIEQAEDRGRHREADYYRGRLRHLANNNLSKTQNGD